MLTNIADSEKHPFGVLALKNDLSDDQEKRILELMDKARLKIIDGVPMPDAEFERQIYIIVPLHKGESHFARAIVAALKDEHRYEDVYRHMRESRADPR